jgi:hypothetical protein
LPREIGLGVFVAILSAAGAFLLGGIVADSVRRRPVVVAVVAPGLLGGLVLSLVGRYSVQTFDEWWHTATGQPGLYSTPVPLVVVQILLLLPRAALIRVLLERFTHSSGTHLGTLLMGSSERNQRRTAAELLWRGRRQGEFWSIVPLAWWGYWDLTTFSLLAPTGFVSAPVRLYNFMHYRQNAVLSAMLAASILLPALAAAAAWWGARKTTLRFAKRN